MHMQKNPAIPDAAAGPAVYRQYARQWLGANLPAHMHHQASSKGGAVVQVQAMGPFEIIYIDPKDDPRKAAEYKAKAGKTGKTK